MYKLQFCTFIMKIGESRGIVKRLHKQPGVAVFRFFVETGVGNLTLPLAVSSTTFGLPVSVD